MNNTKKSCQQNQQLEHEFLTDKINIFKWSYMLDYVSDRSVLRDMTFDSDRSIRREA